VTIDDDQPSQRGHARLGPSRTDHVAIGQQAIARLLGCTSGYAATVSATETGRHVIVATPGDVAALCRPIGAAPATVFACCEIYMVEGEPADCDPAAIARRTMSAAQVGDIVAFIGESPFWCFDVSTLDEINASLANSSLPSLSPAGARLIAFRAAGIGETDCADAWYLGVKGGACLDLPEKPEAVTPQFCASWLAEIIVYILSIEAQKRIFQGEAAEAASGLADGDWDALRASAKAAARHSAEDHAAVAGAALARIAPKSC
jgi:hypothetical protein